MIIIDVFSRYADAIELKSKTIGDCVNGLKTMLDRNKIKPEVIMSDSESSFKSNEFQQFLNLRKIIHDVVILNDHNALGIVDNFCKMLRKQLTRLFIGTGSTEWINYLPTIIQIYNNSKNSSILHHSPVDVLENPEIQEDIAELNHEKNEANTSMKENVSIKVGDNVRTFIKHKFKKHTTYTNEIFKVVEIHGKNFTLSNGKTYVEADLQKTNDDIPTENPIDEAAKQHKISKKLKKEGLTRPSQSKLQEPRASRNKKVDYKKLSGMK
jgi:hypothetical protein